MQPILKSDLIKGRTQVKQGLICRVPRAPARGYLLKVLGGHFASLVALNKNKRFGLPISPKFCENLPMSYSIRIGLFLACVFLMCIGNIAHAETQFSIGSIIRGFELPQMDEQGNLRSKIKGSEAIVISANQIRIKELFIELYDGGKASTRIKSPDCVFWRLENRLTTDQAIEVARDGMIIKAKGMDWSLKENQGIFRQNVQVTIDPKTHILNP